MSVELYKKKVLKRKIIIHTVQAFLLLGFILMWEILSRKGVLNEFLFSKRAETMIYFFT